MCIRLWWNVNFLLKARHKMLRTNIIVHGLALVVSYFILDSLCKCNNNSNTVAIKIAQRLTKSHRRFNVIPTLRFFIKTINGMPVCPLHIFQLALTFSCEISYIFNLSNLSQINFHGSTTIFTDGWEHGRWNHLVDPLRHTKFSFVKRVAKYSKDKPYWCRRVTLEASLFIKISPLKMFS